MEARMGKHGLIFNFRKCAGLSVGTATACVMFCQSDNSPLAGGERGLLNRQVKLAAAGWACAFAVRGA